MKHVRKALALMLAMFVSLIVAAPAFAAPVQRDMQGTDDGSITVTNAEPQTYDLYKVFDATLQKEDKTVTPNVPMQIAYKVSADQLDATKAHGGIQNDTYFNANFELKPDAASGPYVVIKSGVTLDPSTADFQAFAEKFGDKVDTVDNTTTKGEAIEWTNLDYGYYYIHTTTGALVTVNSTTPHADVIDKNPKTGIKKTITSPSHDLSTDAKTNSAALNEEIGFKIDGDAKNYEKGKKVFAYYIEDTMDAGFSIVGEPVVKVGTKTLTKDTDYTYTPAATGTGFTIYIPWTDDGDISQGKASTIDGEHLYAATDKIEVTYTAKLDGANASSINYDGANNNTAVIKNRKGDDTPDIVPPAQPPTGEDWPEDETNTYVTGIDITKVDDATPAKALAGAVFTLTKWNGTDAWDANLDAVVVVKSSSTPTYVTPWTQGTKYWANSNAASGYTADDPTTPAEAYVDPSGDTTKDLPAVDWTDASTWRGATTDIADVDQAKKEKENYKFDLTTYTGYTDGQVNPADLPVYEQQQQQGGSVTAKGTGYSTAITATTDANGLATFASLAPGRYKIEETTVPAGYVKAADHIYDVTFDPATKKFTWTMVEPTAATQGTEIAADTMMAETIVDPIGTEFPETGGMGTRILYTVGGLMVAGAAIYLITKKRMASEA